MLKGKGYVAMLLLAVFCCLFPADMLAEEELVAFGDFESWITRSIKESTIVGGKTQKLYEVGPTGIYDGPRAYTNQGGSPWACSNVYAKVYGVVKTNISVYPDTHDNGLCAKLTTHIVSCKAIGIVNISALATGSLFLGTLLEPITDTANPMAKMDMSTPFTHKPKALKFDYKFYTPGTPRIRETGFGRRQEVSGQDMAQCICLLQKRWEDADGNIHALRVGSMLQRFSQNTSEWKDGQTFTIHYGDITHESFYQDWMGLRTGNNTFCAKNSKGKIVPVQEEGWARPDDEPTHIILKFDSSHGSAYTGTVGNTLWIDNVKFVY
ncbi:MAG: PCMD domain-containing protein [Prevotellaceae bacterium]|nr:PCMD domain-containing protein [Prevotellaceae bacterium]